MGVTHWASAEAVLNAASSDSARSSANRLASAAILGASLGLLGVALWLTPDPRGHGSHVQLGLPPCLPMMLWHVPCPTCGMCTAFAHAARGELLSAFHAQPAGLLLAVLTAAAVAISALSLITGRRLFLPKLSAMQLALIAIAVLLFGWGYKACMTFMGI